MPDALSPVICELSEYIRIHVGASCGFFDRKHLFWLLSIFICLAQKTKNKLLVIDNKCRESTWTWGDWKWPTNTLSTRAQAKCFISIRTNNRSTTPDKFIFHFTVSVYLVRSLIAGTNMVRAQTSKNQLWPNYITMNSMQRCSTSVASIAHMRSYTKKLREYFSNAKPFLITQSRRVATHNQFRSFLLFISPTFAFVQQKKRRRENREKKLIIYRYAWTA